MNKTIKILIVLIFALGMSACKKKEEVKPTVDADNRGDTTAQVTSVVDSGPICCNPSDLTNPSSLLSKRVIYFDYDQSNIRSEYREILALHARYLNENSSARMVLEGHADERGSREYNIALSEKRGNSVNSLLRANSNQVSVVSYGEERPVATCSDESCWSQNRRVVIVYTAE